MEIYLILMLTILLIITIERLLKLERIVLGRRCPNCKRDRP